MKNLKKVITVLILAAVTFTSAGNDIADPDDSEIARLKAENAALEKEIGILKSKLDEDTLSSSKSSYELALGSGNDYDSGNESDSLFEMSLQELMELEVGTASLTKTTKRLTPSTVTTISKEDIQHSGARSLIELLEIYVPSFQWIFHGAKPRHLGLRGINGKDDKYLLLVNGRQMNEKTDFGVISERDLPMLGDIREIQVIRGPGSALYGPGALSMVINLLIDTPETFQGFEANMRVGAIEEFYSSEFKWGKKFSDDKGLLIYGGASIYPGAARNVSPLRLTCDSPGAYKNGGDYYPNQYYSESTGMKYYNEAYRGLPRVKLHAHYMRGNLDVWARYTQGGEYMDQIEYTPIEGGNPQRDIAYGEGYRQATITAEYKQKFSDKFSVQYRFSYDQMNIETAPYSFCRELQYREDEYQGRILANWDVHENHKLAFGGEWVHEEFGLDPMLFSHHNTFNYTMGEKIEMPRWGSDLRSLVGEWQWGISKNLTAFFSGRLDDHTMVKPMFSPRASFIYTPNKRDTFKLMLSRSSRTQAAEDIKKADLAGNPNADYETLDAMELRYERQHNENLWWAVSAYKHKQDMVSYSPQLGGTGPVGIFKSTGIEVEAKYKKDKLEVIASHAFTKLDNANLDDGIYEVEETAADNTDTGSDIYGMGSNWANWSNHQSKIHINYEVTPKWLLTTNLSILWGYPGGLDYAKWVTRYSWRWRRWNPHADEAFVKPSYFWNAGLEHKYNDNLTFRVDAYNILGWFDRDLGKRRSGFNNDFLGQYRVQPPAFGFQLIYKF